MTNLEEKQIYFVGENSYKENKGTTDKQLLRNLICEINEIIDIKINNQILSSKLKKELETNNEGLNLRFSLTYPDYDLYPDESVMKIGLEIQEKINEILDRNYKTLSNIYCDFSPNWRGSYLRISLNVRPFRGYFICPICKNEIEESEQYYDDLPEDNIALCIGTDHNTFLWKIILIKNFILKIVLKLTKI